MPTTRINVDRDKVYTLHLVPANSKAPTYVYGIYGKTDARVGNYLTGSAVERVANKFHRSKYNEHYSVQVQQVNTNMVGGKRIVEAARDNDRELGKLYDDAMRDLNTFYRNSMLQDYGPEWDYQPRGGSTSNSPI